MSELSEAPQFPSLPISHLATASMLPAYTLAGGKSSRFGSDKALATIEDVPLVLRVVQTLRSHCEPVAVVAGETGKYGTLGLETIADRLPRRGPLGGLHAALCDRLDRFGPGWIVLASCDLAGLKPEWVETLACSIESFHCDGREHAIAFRGSYWQPFPAAYHTDLVPVIEGRLEAGRASFQGVLSDPCTNAVALPLPADWPEVVQVNTQDELTRFRQRPSSSRSKDDLGNGSGI